ncbi:MAG: thiol reductant ABC exporter subunit CydD, partial [Brevundimonas diminuta]|nr:thiol reductant ABC exporter subunit CydD [Brevundimonas diminuta]
MTAQPVDPQQADSRRIAETTAPAAWLKSALSPWRRLMSLGGALVIADTLPAIGFAAGLALAVGALPQGLAEA